MYSEQICSPGIRSVLILLITVPGGPQNLLTRADHRESVCMGMAYPQGGSFERLDNFYGILNGGLNRKANRFSQKTDTFYTSSHPVTGSKTTSSTYASCRSPSSSALHQASILPYESSVPNIDVCGSARGAISCPGAGMPPSADTMGYYYRCCSQHGHCGPKNNIQNQNLYCGTGCQTDYGDCSTDRNPPPLPLTSPTLAENGDPCGPLVNAKCAAGLCCSGSNYCGMWHGSDSG